VVASLFGFPEPFSAADVVVMLVAAVVVAVGVAANAGLVAQRTDAMMDAPNAK
jgi:hypothetical protein